ncbi:alpha/beta hydrolase [Petrotoga sp. 9PWA.NaAc.5.4]|uniref:alpha/beta hydrolase n=1 Tax=Petrotoga sp. 9PWA.NaAc.5.4 TaxID=1434328 RepID=UPI000EFA3995|nr:alpha/beta hydrolase [Petrotoga sp. 9PWA.NaAc.5.4]
MKFDIYFPSKKKNAFPVVFFAHGGGWITGSRKLASATAWAKFLASRGFAVVSIDYRYAYFHKYEALIEDYSNALQYIKTHAKDLNIDKNKIILMGTSAGGTLSLYYAAYHTFNHNWEEMQGITGVVSWYAPADLLDLWNQQVESLFAKFAITTTMKGSPKRKIEDYKLYSPINYVSKYMIPTLLVHGKKDTTVPVDSSIKLYKKLKEFGVDVSLLIHPKGDHSFELELKDFLTIKFVEKTVNFMKEVCEKEKSVVLN